MSANKYNTEGYFDPTAYEALTKIEKEEAKSHPGYRPLVYICSPYSGDVDRNVETARRYCRSAVDKGYIPVAPHLLYPQFLNDNSPKERELGMFFGNVLMSKCSELWVCGNIVSEGMMAEINRAKRKSYRIRYFSSEMEETTK